MATAAIVTRFNMTSARRSIGGALLLQRLQEDGGRLRELLLRVGEEHAFGILLWRPAECGRRSDVGAMVDEVLHDRRLPRDDGADQRGAAAVSGIADAELQ